MDIHIQKNPSISLHSQLVTQISMQIASGLLKPGAKLPSIRALSSKLGIHHNTCLSAYRELDETGLIEIRHGSGARVALLDNDKQSAQQLVETPELEELARFFVRQVMRKGHAWEDAVAALDVARGDLSEQVRQPLLFVDIHADILPVFQAELQHALERPVWGALLSQIDSQAERNTHFIVSRYHFQALRERLKEHFHPERVTVIEVGSGQQELALIRQLPEHALTAVFSASTIILRQAEAVVKALRGEDIFIRTVLDGHESSAEVQRILKRAQLIFADFLTVPTLQTLTRKPVHVVRVIPEHELEKLKAFKS